MALGFFWCVNSAGKQSVGGDEPEKASQLLSALNWEDLLLFLAHSAAPSTQARTCMHT